MKSPRRVLHSIAWVCSLLAAHGSSPAEPAGQSTKDSSVYQLDSRWTTDSGRSIRLADLGGQYQVVAFIFTHCGGACPLLVKSLQLQSRSMPATIREQARFVLVTIDPDQDTVTALHQYRKDMSLDEHWTLLHGKDSDVRELTAVVGFNYDRMPGGQFAHSNQVTLLDPHGEIVLQHPTAEGALSAMSDAIAKLQRK